MKICKLAGTIFVPTEIIFALYFHFQNQLVGNPDQLKIFLQSEMAFYMSFSRCKSYVTKLPYIPKDSVMRLAPHRNNKAVGAVAKGITQLCPLQQPRTPKKRKIHKCFSVNGKPSA